jgi:hypothetical protein
MSYREQVNFQLDDDEVRFVLDQHTWLDFYSAISPKQQSTDRHVTQLGHIIIILNAACFTEKQQNQFYILWFDLIGARTHYLPHLRRAR